MQKKQFRTYDIYRTCSVGVTSFIAGMTYVATKSGDSLWVSVTFNNGGIWSAYFYNETELRQFVKDVNKHLKEVR